MHAKFPDWVRGLYPDTSVEILPLEAWWAAVEDFVAEANNADMIGLSRAAYGRATPEFDARWRAALREHDRNSPLSGGDRQVSALAAIAILYASELPTHASAALYLRRCAAHLEWNPSVADLELTAAGLSEAAKASRTLEPWPQPKRMALQSRAVHDALVQIQSVPAPATTLEPVFDLLIKGMNDLVARSANALTKAASGREAPLMEQSDVLVWLLSGQCGSADKSWDHLARLEASTFAAIELRGLSRFPLGRPDARALISTAVDSANEGAKADVKALCATVEESVLPLRDDVHELVPLLLSVLGGNPLKLDPIDFGTRLHDELGLLSALKA